MLSLLATSPSCAILLRTCHYKNQCQPILYNVCSSNDCFLAVSTMKLLISRQILHIIYIYQTIFMDYSIFYFFFFYETQVVNGINLLDDSNDDGTTSGGEEGEGGGSLTMWSGVVRSEWSEEVGVGSGGGGGGSGGGGSGGSGGGGGSGGSKKQIQQSFANVSMIIFKNPMRTNENDDKEPSQLVEMTLRSTKDCGLLIGNTINQTVIECRVLFNLRCSSSIPRLNFDSLLYSEDEYRYVSDTMYSLQVRPEYNGISMHASVGVGAAAASSSLPSCMMVSGEEKKSEDDNNDDVLKKTKWVASKNHPHWWNSCRMLGGANGYPRVSDTQSGWITEIRSPINSKQRYDNGGSSSSNNSNLTEIGIGKFMSIYFFFFDIFFFDIF